MAQLARITGRILVLFVVVFVAVVGQASAEETAAPYGGRWIDVNLTTQKITAFQAGKAMYTAGASTGKKGYATPTGTFYVISRFRIQDMSSARGAAQPYFQPNVEYIQYFHFPGGYALHANYWQPASVFGHTPTSHGCVGMLKKDAIYFWNFADVGTPIYIHTGKTTSASPVATVSSVVGKDQSSAQAALQAEGFRVAIKTTATMLEEPGTVMWETPPAGEVVTKGAIVTLTVAAARPRADVRPPEGAFAWAPDVVGLAEEDAVARFRDAGFGAIYVNYYDEKSVPSTEKGALQRVRPGAVFAQMTDVGQIRLDGSDYVVSVRRDLGSEQATQLRFVVANTLGDGVNLREGPSVKAGYIRTIAAGAVVVATGPSVTAEGAVWYPVKDDKGKTGWVQGAYLSVAP